ncbi:4-hydroxyphenylpyruvate dioxygenase [Nocardioides aromaticivorans]|uniref:3-dehydroshikimate dehydratase n=1 Tax=Nocardioides aromaticivorans TaxID=200618 RepID=A0A7Y9ZHR8_9ACTN|nr:sugar phosphate isomerase/epimerase and 4-hydroxyphenylpyruvate domain-containing protein [Nocardioides aromaticivorans]NYI45679.1 4-hydroxyphenylpyruvate dioxygenase [Nocardioides aromaticivorans]
MTLRRSIATVSLSGVLADKLDAAAAAGFDGIEVFDNDLVASPLSPAEVAARCADLGLRVELFQPVRDVEGVAPSDFPAVVRRVARKLDVAAALGAPAVLLCSNVQPDAIDDPDLSAAQLATLGDLAAERGLVLAFEALAWGRHVHRVGQAWDIVQRAAHPAVTLAVDTFHMLSRGDGPEALEGVPGDRIGFLQVADAPLLDMDVLEWSRHHRCFPGQGTMDVSGVVDAVIRSGYDGPLSLEVFSDVVREAPAAETARDALRSLVFLEDELARLRPGGTPLAPAVPERADAAFLELPAGPATDDLLVRLGFTLAGWHRHKPVAWWRNGSADVLVNAAATEPALGIVASPVAQVAERAEALLWPSVAVSRTPGDSLLPGITSPAGVPVFVSAPAGEQDDWQRDFAAAPGRSPEGWVGLDHLGVAVPAGRLNEEVAFLRTLLGLEPAPLEEFIDPHGRIRSRAFRPAKGELRVVVNVAEVADVPRPTGVVQVAFGCTDLLAEVRRLRAAGVPLMAVPDNYYVDLEARLDLDAAFVATLREHGALYDRSAQGELLHAYTPVLPQGFCIELLERRGGYDGYGAANTHVRLAAQSPR